jgi:hypothetical protein
MTQLTENSNSLSPTQDTLKTSVIEKRLPYIAAFWFFVVLNSYLVWNPLAPIVHFLPALLIVWGTCLLSDKLARTSYYRILFCCITIYFFWIVLSFCDTFGSIIKRCTDFFPLLCIILWPSELILKSYEIIRKVIIFYAIGSAILSVLILLGLNERLPHLVLPPRETIHVNRGIVYYLYGLFIANCSTSIGVTGVSSRACGMLQEPGHFAILLGFIYLIDRLSGRKINYWIVICGLLTFSSAFILIVFFTEIYSIFSLKRLRKVVISLPFIVLFLFLLYSFLPSGIQEQIEYYAYGRNLEKVIEALSETSSLTGALDERASDFSIANYEKMTTMQYVFGGGHRDRGDVLSDYRGMVINVGYVGVFLAIFIYLAIFVRTPLKIKIALGLSFFLVLLHRSWMLYQPYIFIEGFMAVIAYRKSQERVYNDIKS